MFTVKIWDHCRYVTRREAPYDEMARHLESCRRAGITSANIYLPEVISLPDYCRAAAAAGMKVEARITPTWNHPEAVKRTLPEEAWREMEARFGIRLAGPCLNHPENRRAFAANAAALLAEYAPQLAGLHLDFIRNDNAVLLLPYPCRCDGCRAERQRYFGAEAPPPADYEQPAVLYKELEIRNRNVRRTVAAIRETTARHGVELTIAARANYLDEPDVTAAPVWGLGPAVCEGQDWVDWLGDGLIDAAYPMNYHTDAALFRRLLTDYIRLLSGDVGRLLSGVGLASSMGELDDAAFRRHLEIVRDLGFPGAVIFNKTNLYSPTQLSIIRDFAAG